MFDGTVGQKLAIADKLEIDWETYPVLHVDLNAGKYDTIESLYKRLDKILSDWENKYGCQAWEYPPEIRFETIIKAAFEKSGHCVVILVDEYDKPLLQAIGNSNLLQEFRETLKAFYGVLKSMDKYIKFALLTGVTKFSKASVFSDLNNLNDISMDYACWDICGLSEKELQSYFEREISNLAKENGMTYEECVVALRQRYDGYRFHQASSGVYNPFSVLCTFNKNEFGSYWFETGTPSYLVNLLKEHEYNLETMSTDISDVDSLSGIDLTGDNPIPVIYQSGYLTIKGYDKEFNVYHLGFPNVEVEEGFLHFLLPYYTSIAKGKTAFSIQQFVNDVREGRTEMFLERLKSLFADTPYEIVKNMENHCQNVLWLVSKLMGFYVHAEYRTSNGRIDLVLQTSRFCYVMEFKLDGTAKEALQQINDKNYAMPFIMGSQKVIKIGINFDSKTRNIDSYVIG